ncbi:MAG: class I SAM-dependent methyltransferase [Hyphomicrobiaceae bacterium]
MRLYSDLAEWYSLITPASEYAEEADHLVRLIDAMRDGPAAAFLELGAGAGHMASHLKTRFRCTLTDLSPEMLKLSRALNPECEHRLADMRTLALDRTFDIVLAHDAICYMTTEADQRSAIETAARHLRRGGVAIFLPDDVKDTFRNSTTCGGHDAGDGRGVRYLEWTSDPDPSDTTIVMEFALLIREAGKAVRVEHDTHLLGLFDRATWRRHMRSAGFAVLEPTVFDPYAGQHEVFVGRKM